MRPMLAKDTEDTKLGADEKPRVLRFAQSTKLRIKIKFLTISDTPLGKVVHKDM